MGILNVTPDSFSDGGKFSNVASALDRIYIMLKQGAQIIDIGGESTRPDAESVTEQEELERVVPVLTEAMKHFPNAEFSIDTTKFKVAQQCLELGATMVNDVSGLRKEPQLAGLCAKFDATYVLMHSIGDPTTMQKNPEYDDVVEHVADFFEAKIEVLQNAGVKKIVLDPGIGFGKTLEHNLALIAQLATFQKFGFPLLMGASRKSMIGQILDNCAPKDRVIGTVAAHYHSLVNGAHILRVHDVKEATESIRIFQAVQSQQ